MIGKELYEKVTCDLREELSQCNFTEQLYRTFSVKVMNEKQDSFPTHLYFIPKLFKVPLLTTNFNRNIEFIYTK